MRFQHTVHGGLLCLFLFGGLWFNTATADDEQPNEESVTSSAEETTEENAIEDASQNSFGRAAGIAAAHAEKTARQGVNRVREEIEACASDPVCRQRWEDALRTALEILQQAVEAAARLTGEALSGYNEECARISCHQP